MRLYVRIVDIGEKTSRHLAVNADQLHPLQKSVSVPLSMMSEPDRTAADRTVLLVIRVVVVNAHARRRTGAARHPCVRAIMLRADRIAASRAGGAVAA